MCNELCNELCYRLFIVPLSSRRAQLPTKINDAKGASHAKSIDYRNETCQRSAHRASHHNPRKAMQKALLVHPVIPYPTSPSKSQVQIQSTNSKTEDFIPMSKISFSRDRVCASSDWESIAYSIVSIGSCKSMISRSTSPLAFEVGVIGGKGRVVREYILWNRT